MPTVRYDHVSPKTVRFWAMLDSGVLALALPITAKAFLGVIYWVNGRLGFDHAMPAFEPIHMVFVNMLGVLVAVWVAARLLHPVGLMAMIDAVGRTAVALLLAYVIVVQAAPPVLWLFVFTEGIGAVAQFRACLRRPTV